MARSKVRRCQREPVSILGGDHGPRRSKHAYRRKDEVSKGDPTVFSVTTANTRYRSRAVVLALGRTGTPRKLGVKGEELPKVMYRLIEADHYTNKKILVVGGGDSAVEAVMGLAHQPGNRVTVSYRKERFSRIKDRNEKRIEDCIRSGNIQALFNSTPVEFKSESVIIDVKGERQEIPNDFVWIFAGGTPAFDFLKKIGVGFGMCDQTQEAGKEARQAATDKSQLVGMRAR